MNNEIREKFSNFRKVDWNKILPSCNQVLMDFDGYKSKISISDKNNKLYIDPEFGHPIIRAKVDYTLLKGTWEIDEYTEDGLHKIKLTDDISGQSIEFTFSSLSDKVSFVNELYSSNPIKQTNTGINVENLVNKKSRRRKKILTGLIIGGITGGLLYLLNKNKVNR